MDILTSNYVNESFINPSYSERMGLTYRQAKGKLTLKDKIRLKLMKYLGKSREGLAAKLQDKSLKAAGYAIKLNDDLEKNPKKLALASIGGTALGAGGAAAYMMTFGKKKNKQNSLKNLGQEYSTSREVDEKDVPEWAKNGHSNQ